MLPTDAKARKDLPLVAGFLDYFPLAIIEVAKASKAGNDQHNPGKSLRWDRSKSGDESEALMRHFFDRGKVDSDGVRHTAKVAWRAMAMLQKEMEAAQAAEANEQEPARKLLDWMTRPAAQPMPRPAPNCTRCDMPEMGCVCGHSGDCACDKCKAYTASLGVE